MSNHLALLARRIGAPQSRRPALVACLAVVLLALVALATVRFGLQ
jgi:hypothetical protein